MAQWFRETFHGVEGPIGEDSCDLGGIPGDEQADRFEIAESLEGPVYASHLAMRRRASSWLISSPASA